MEKLKEFFSPVKGGHNDGLTFFPWAWGLGRLPLTLLWLVVGIVVTLFGDTSVWQPKIYFYIVNIAIYIMSGVIFYMQVINHWKILKW